MDYECMNCGYCVGAEKLLTAHYREHPECDKANWQAVGVPVVERCKREILEDIRKGIVPATVKTFAELHDYVDANCYGGACEEDPDGAPGWWDGDEEERDAAMVFWNRVQNEVHRWLKAGRPESQTV